MADPLLLRIQSDFPVHSRPFEKMAGDLGMTEEEVITRVRHLKEEGVIRRLGAVFDTKSLGFSSVLVAMKVPSERIEEVAGIVSADEGVSHNYERSGEFNLWFTLAARSDDELAGKTEDLKRRTGIEEILILPAIRVYKIRAVFDADQ